MTAGRHRPENDAEPQQAAVKPVADPATTPRPAGSAEAVLALQRSSGNAAVSRWITRTSRATIAREPPAGAPAAPPAGAPAAAPPAPRVSYVFLMGDVKNDAFYLAAREYFTNMVKGAILVTDKRTLSDVIAHVNAGGKPVDTLFLVSHANESGNLGFSVDPADLAKDTTSGDRKPRSEYKEIKEANEAGSLPAADVKLIDAQTKIQIKGCNIGRSERMLDEIDRAFGGEATVTAPTHTQEYRFHGKPGAVKYEENLAEMFVEEPGIVTKDAAALASAFKAKYPHVEEKRWKGLLAQAKRNAKSDVRFTWTQPNPPEDEEKSVFKRLKVAKEFPKSAGWVVTYKGRTTVGDKWRFDIEAERVLKDGSTEIQSRSILAPIPPDDAKLIEQEKAKHGRPDGCTWQVKRTVAGDQLKLEVLAERTEWEIGGTIKDASGPYHPSQTDADWYRSSTYAPPPAAPATPPAAAPATP